MRCGYRYINNIVLILSTVKAMTQPEIMNLAGNLTASYQEAERDPALRTGMLDLVGQMRDPEVRRGLALTMRMLRAIAGDPRRDVIARIEARGIRVVSAELADAEHPVRHSADRLFDALAEVW